MADSGRAMLDASLATLERRLVGVGGPFELCAGPGGAPRYVGRPRSLIDLYDRARRMGQAALLAHGDERRSYGSVFEPALALAGSLRQQGWSGRRIALALDDGAEWLIWFVAITAAGASCVIPPPGGSDELTKMCCTTAGCEAVAASASHPLANVGLTNLYAATAAGSETAPALDVSPEAEAVVAFTSGSTGAPKGVIHTHRSLVSGLRNMMLGGALASHMLPASSAGPERPQAPSTLLLSPLAYIGGYSAFMLCIATGGRLVLPVDRDEDAVVELVRTEGVLALGGAASDLIRRLVRHPAAPDALRSLRRLHLHGAALQKSLVDELRDVLPATQLLTGYGASETAGSIAVASVAQVVDEVGGCGRLLPSVDLRVVDEGGSVLPSGAEGRLEIRGDMLMSGYLDASRTATAMTDDGWYRTGDFGRLGDGRWLTVAGRGDDRIAGTEQFAAPVEDAVRALRGVDDAVVAPSTDGNALILYLQVRPEETVDKASTIEALKATAGWAGPVDVRLLENFPRTASGKIDRLRLGA